MCPDSPSAEDGAETKTSDVGVDGIEVGVTKLKSGVAICSVGADGVYDCGVEACSVANRSGVGDDAAGMLHPAIKRKRMNVNESLNLFAIQCE